MGTSTTTMGVTVAALARQVGMKPDTVRYYERVGLLSPPRTATDHRRYDDGTIDRLRFVQGAQRLGMRVVDIRELLTLRDTGECPSEPAADLMRHRAGADR
jgi:DNA-binding transcriptional MerR regulator